MMGSPFYYDVLFDDGPGDVVFHDCMWSGICTCCIQLLHQDSYYQFANESPDLKVEDLNCRTQQSSTTTLASSTPTLASSTTNSSSTTLASSTTSSSTTTTSTSTNAPNNISIMIQVEQQAEQKSKRAAKIDQGVMKAATNLIKEVKMEDCGARAICDLNCNPQGFGQDGKQVSMNMVKLQGTTTVEHSDTKYFNMSSSSSSASSPSSSSSSSPSSSSPNCSNSTSPKPIRRREHNDSERKRRDHLRNAFNFLRDQVPRFKAINKKPPRIQILHEATKYVQAIMKEAEDLERRLEEEKAKHERLKMI